MNGISMVNKLMVIYLAVIGGVYLRCLTKSDSLIASVDATASSATDNDIYFTFFMYCARSL